MGARRRIRLVLAVSVVMAATFASLAGLRVQAEEAPARITEVTGVPVPGGRGPILVPVEEQENRLQRRQLD